MDPLHLILYYIVGFVLNLLFYIKFGKRMGLDYDQPKTYVNHDDWRSNDEAYLFFSIVWPFLMPIFMCFYLVYGLKLLVALCMKKKNDKADEPY